MPRGPRITWRSARTPCWPRPSCGRVLSTARPAGAVVGVDELFGQAAGHGLALLLAGVVHDPADRERLLAVALDLARDLVVRAADALGAHLDDRPHVLDRLGEDLRPARGRWQLLLREVEGLVEDLLRDASSSPRSMILLMIFVGEQRSELRIGLEQRGGRDCSCAASGSWSRGHFFGRLVPYLERSWSRPSTPEASSVPRRMW